MEKLQNLELIKLFNMGNFKVFWVSFSVIIPEQFLFAWFLVRYVAQHLIIVAHLFPTTYFLLSSIVHRRSVVNQTSILINNLLSSVFVCTLNFTLMSLRIAQKARKKKKEKCCCSISTNKIIIGSIECTHVRVINFAYIISLLVMRLMYVILTLCSRHQRTQVTCLLAGFLAFTLGSCALWVKHQRKLCRLGWEKNVFYVDSTWFWPQTC